MPSRFSAVDGWAAYEKGDIPKGHWGMQTPGFAGSWISHQKCVRISDGEFSDPERPPRDVVFPLSVLILEDDAVPAPDFAQRAEAMLTQLYDYDTGWEGLWLGYDPNYNDKTVVATNLTRHRNPLNTHAYALTGRLLKQAAALDPAKAGRAHWDGMLKNLCPTHRVYAPRHGELVGQAVWYGADDPKDNYEDTR